MAEIDPTKPTAGNALTQDVRDNFQAAIDQDDAQKADIAQKVNRSGDEMAGNLGFSNSWPIYYGGDAEGGTYIRYSVKEKDLAGGIIFGYIDGGNNFYATLESRDHTDTYRGSPWELSYRDDNDDMVWQVKLINRAGVQVSRLRLDQTGNLQIPYSNPLLAKDAATKDYVDSLSDQRLKENIRPFNALAIVEQLKLYKFEWTEGIPDAGKTSANVIAQELSLTLPEFVHQNINYSTPDTGPGPTAPGDGELISDFYYVDRDALLAYALRAIQELSERVKALETN